jgi:hypothetical protein
VPQNSVEDTANREFNMQNAGNSGNRERGRMRRLFIYRAMEGLYQKLVINISEVPNAKIFQIRYSKNWKLGSIWLVIFFVSSLLWVMLGMLFYYFLR